MEAEFSTVAALIGDPVRSKIMWALLDARAYTAIELATYTGTTPSNISMHLAKLVQAGLLSVEKQGRHRYYNYAHPGIAHAIEAMASLITGPDRPLQKHHVDDPVKYCRSCYDHLAGKVGVMLAESMLRQEIMIRSGSEFEVSPVGEAFLMKLDIDVTGLKKQKRSFARPCLDWSERKPHLAGSLGAALLEQFISKGWMRRISHSRAIVITGKGREALLANFNIEIP